MQVGDTGPAESTRRGNLQRVGLLFLGSRDTNDLVDIETDISRNLKGLVAIEIANAVRKKSLAEVETAIWFFETQPRREREPDR